MNEYTIVFKEGLATGLRHSAKTPMGAQSLIKSQGAIFDKGVLVNTPNILSMDLSELNCFFPFPQIFKLREFVLVCTPSDIYTYDRVLTKVFSGEVGSTWTVADFNYFVLMTNGKSFAALDPAAKWTN